MNEKDDMITHLGILSNLENGRKLARFSNSPETPPDTVNLLSVRFFPFREVTPFRGKVNSLWLSKVVEAHC